jgi:hypothetical protein
MKKSLEKDKIQDVQKGNFITGPETVAKLKNETGNGLTCFTPREWSKSDLILGKVERRFDTK